MVVTQPRHLLELINEDGNSQYYTTTTRTDGDGWVLDCSKAMMMIDVAYSFFTKDKIKRALGFTHYAKNGKLFRNSWAKGRR